MKRLQAAGGITAQPRGPAGLVLSVRGGVTPIELEITPRFSPECLDQIEGLPAGVRERTVLVVPELSIKRREELRFRHLSWVEHRTGFVHLRVPGVAIDLPEDPTFKPDQGATLPDLSGKAGIVLEALIELARTEDLVAQPDVAEASGSTQAWTSRIFKALVEAEALEVIGSGPNKKWRPDVGKILDLWIADGGPTPQATGMYLWSRTPQDLLRSIARISALGCRYAIGGISAANLYEPTLTAIPTHDIWIEHMRPPQEIALALDGDLVESGPNIFFWQASGDPALHLARGLSTWQGNQRAGPPDPIVVTPARAVVESMQEPGRAREVGERLKERLLAGTVSNDE